nr:hypothetical protein [Tanacetum cinerariifolium]
MQQAEMAELRETDRRHQAQMVETLLVMGDMRREMGDMQAELLALREQPRRARQPRGDARVPNHQDAHRNADSSRYKVEESSTTRPTEGRGIYYGFVSTLNAEARRRGIREVGYGIRDTWIDPIETVPEIAPMTVGERVDLLMEDRIAHQETIQIMEEEAYVAREA